MVTTRVIPAVEARTHLGEIMKKSFQKGNHYIVEKSGIAMVAIINANDYSKLIQEREERFKIIDKIRSHIPNVPSDEVVDDVAKAVKETREKKR